MKVLFHRLDVVPRVYRLGVNGLGRSFWWVVGVGGCKAGLTIGCLAVEVGLG